MCNPVAIAMMAAGLGANEYGSRRAEKATNNVLSDGSAALREKQGRINSEVLNTAKETFDPNSMGDRYEDAATQREQTLGAAMADINKAPADGATGAVSEDYLRGKAERATKQMEAIAKLTRLMGRSGAGDTVNLENSMRVMDSNDRVAGIGQEMQQTQSLMSTRLGEASHKGDDAKLVGQLLQLGGVMYAPAGAAGLTAGQKAAVTLPAARSSGATANAMFGNIS